MEPQESSQSPSPYHSPSSKMLLSQLAQSIFQGAEHQDWVEVNWLLQSLAPKYSVFGINPDF